jgi:hypothetical protein
VIIFEDFLNLRLPDPPLGFLGYVEKGNVLFFSFFHVASSPYFALRGAQNIHWTRHEKKV